MPDRSQPSAAPLLSWPSCRSCGGGGWVGARVDHKHPGCGHRCILCDPPPGYDQTYAKGSPASAAPLRGDGDIGWVFDPEHPDYPLGPGLRLTERRTTLPSGEVVVTTVVEESDDA